MGFVSLPRSVALLGRHSVLPPRDNSRSDDTQISLVGESFSDPSVGSLRGTKYSARPNDAMRVIAVDIGSTEDH